MMLPNLGGLFIDLRQNKRKYLASTTGKEFESRIETKMHTLGFSRVQQDNIEKLKFELIKQTVLGKESEEDIANICPEFNRHYIIQPFGSQNYPDFLVFWGDMLFGIETKYSKSGQGHPVWNSGLPRPNGIYIFGASGAQDLTFFRGNDVLSVADARQLHDFFDRGLKEYQTRFNKDSMCEQPYGFAVYIRKAFEQKKTFNKNAVLNMFTNPQRTKLENAVIAHLQHIENS